MAPDPEPTRSRRLRLAVDDEALRRELAGLLARERIEVEFVSRLEPADLTELEADAIVIDADSAKEGGAELLERSQDEDAPGVLVLSDEDHATEHARMVARGASAVLDADREDLGERIAELVEAEAAGGLHGPEGRGADADSKLADFQSRSERMKDFLELVRRVAASDSTLLITGETGVGKERLARAIHAESGRDRAGPSSRSTAAPCPRTCSRASCSGTCAAPSPALRPLARVASRRRTAARSCWTRSGRCRRTCRSTC